MNKELEAQQKFAAYLKGKNDRDEPREFSPPQWIRTNPKLVSFYKGGYYSEEA